MALWSHNKLYQLKIQPIIFNSFVLPHKRRQGNRGCKGENEGKNTARDLQSLGHHFSQPLHGKHLHVTEHFDVCLTNLGSLTLWMAHSQGAASLMAAALTVSRWAEYCQEQLNIHHLLIPVSSFCWSVNIKYGKCHNYCSFGDIKV